MSAARFLVSGHVQGVAFRAHARHEAQNLGVTGHARNLPDGRVEVIAHGDAAVLEEFAAWLAHGPALARVDAVHRESHDATSTPDIFTIG
ncbi:acylphosphatase [Lysobacter sp. TY2-98]|uniref:acylphosphatase n=1 Tax=Lysobacter sp. TY2-98 TaxID=2290922 RepID=UPI000E200415|nr:acylphosphatase [Lysobacter sp. TY2-98]AXK72570.1 acylphosphatase [Lysobacter sp. TY2-98]